MAFLEISGLKKRFGAVEILKGIEAFARGNFARMHRLETSDTATNTRLEAIEERLLALELRQRPPHESLLSGP